MTFLATTNYCKSPWFKIRKSPSLCYLTFSFTIKCHCTLRKKCYKTLLSWLSLSKFQYFETAWFIATCCRSPVTRLWEGYWNQSDEKPNTKLIPNSCCQSDNGFYKWCHSNDREIFLKQNWLRKFKFTSCLGVSHISIFIRNAS